MKTKRPTFLTLLLIVILWTLLPFTTLPPVRAWAGQSAAQTDDDMALQELLKENEKLRALGEYKDSEAMLRIKLANLRAINDSRRQAGLEPLKLDILASRVGNKHSADMVEKNFMGHFSSGGEKPYHRYSSAGGQDHISENVYGSWLSGGGVFKDTPEVIEEMMLKGHRGFMAEKPPNDGHRQTILTPYHTHVGIGVALKGGQFRYCQEFIDRYVELESVPAQVRSGSTVLLKGRALSRRYGPYVLLVYYEPTPSPLSDPRRQPGWYDDYTDTVFAKVSPWEMNYDPKERSFEISLGMKEAKPGSYYLMLYVKENPSAIPYNKPSSWDTRGSIPATGIVVVVE